MSSPTGERRVFSGRCHMVATPPARPVDRWCVVGRVCDVVDSSCADTQRQFLERGLPDGEQTSGKGDIQVPEAVLWANHMTRATLLCHQPPCSSLAVTCSLCTSRVKDSVGCLKRPWVPRPACRGLAGPSLRSCRLHFQGRLWHACQSSVQLRMLAPAPARNLWPPGYPSTSSLCSLHCSHPLPLLPLQSGAGNTLQPAA